MKALWNTISFIVHQGGYPLVCMRLQIGFKINSSVVPQPWIIPDFKSLNSLLRQIWVWIQMQCSPGTEVCHETLSSCFALILLPQYLFSAHHLLHAEICSPSLVYFLSQDFSLLFLYLRFHLFFMYWIVWRLRTLFF